MKLLFRHQGIQQEEARTAGYAFKGQPAIFCQTISCQS